MAPTAIETVTAAPTTTGVGAGVSGRPAAGMNVDLRTGAVRIPVKRLWAIAVPPSSTVRRAVNPGEDQPTM